VGQREAEQELFPGLAKWLMLYLNLTSHLIFNLLPNMSFPPAFPIRILPDFLDVCSRFGWLLKLPIPGRIALFTHQDSTGNTLPLGSLPIYLAGRFTWLALDRPRRKTCALSGNAIYINPSKSQIRTNLVYLLIRIPSGNRTLRAFGFPIQSDYYYSTNNTGTEGRASKGESIKGGPSQGTFNSRISTT
jgi:hypothetical protein